MSGRGFCFFRLPRVSLFRVGCGVMSDNLMLKVWFRAIAGGRCSGSAIPQLYSGL